MCHGASFENDIEQVFCHGYVITSFVYVGHGYSSILCLQRRWSQGMDE